MRKDPTVNLARRLSVAPALASKWSVEQKDDAPSGARDLIEKALLPLREHILQTGLLGCSDYGWQSYEKVFDFSEGQTSIGKLKPLLPDFTEILVDKQTGAFMGLRQEAQGDLPEVTLQVEECLLLNQDVEGTNWYGQAVMSNVEVAYDKWLATEKGADRYDRKMAGAHWVVKYPLGTSKVDGADTDNFEIAKKILNSLESSGSVAIPRTLSEHVEMLNESTPDAWKIELLSAQGGVTPFMDRQKYWDALKVRAYTLPERAVLEGQFGTKAEAQVHADLGVTHMEIRHAMLVQQVNWHVVDQLVRANYGPGYDGKVYIQPAPIADLERERLISMYERLLSDPNALMLELGMIDTEAMRDRIGVPTLPNLPGTHDAPGTASMYETAPAVAQAEPVEVVGTPAADVPVADPSQVLAVSHELRRAFGWSAREALELSVSQQSLLLGWVTMNGTPVLIGDEGEIKAPAAVKKALDKRWRHDKEDERKEQKHQQRRKESNWSKSANAAYDQLEERQAAGEDVAQAMANLVEEHGDLPGPGGVGSLRDYVRASQAMREGATAETDAAADQVFAGQATTGPGVKTVGETPPPRVPREPPFREGAATPRGIRQAWQQIRQGNPYPMIKTTKGFFAPVLKALNTAQSAIDAFGSWYEKTFDQPELATSFDTLALASNGESLASTQFDLPDELAARVLDLAEEIEDDDLAEKGREDQPHVTVKYGLRDSVRPGDVRRVVEDYGPIRIVLGDVSIFKSDEYDVVKIDVRSASLHRLHDELCDKLRVAPSDYDEYVPHVTLAYVKPGRGKRYAGPSGLAGESFLVEDLVFSDPDRRHYTIALAHK